MNRLMRRALAKPYGPFDKRKLFVVVLDTMWGEGGIAPSSFLINSENASGRRLYKLTESYYGNVRVVNACREQATHANEHGTPDAAWLAHCLDTLPLAWRARGVPLLICGKVAQRTADACAAVDHWRGEILCLDHPAARTWTKAKIAAAQRRIRAARRK